jgi:hypothetical protein
VTSTIVTSGTVISGPRGTGPAHPLPPIPGATTSTIKITKSGTYPPGSYNSMAAPKNSTINLSSGTYYFTAWNVEDNTVVNCDTTNGCCAIIITSGAEFHNNTLVANTGPNALRVHITSGNLGANDGFGATNADFLVYRGTANFHINTNGTFGIYTSGKISFYRDGTISPNQLPDCP